MQHQVRHQPNIEVCHHASSDSSRASSLSGFVTEDGGWTWSGRSRVRHQPNIGFVVMLRQVHRVRQEALFFIGVRSRRWWLNLKWSESVLLSGNEMAVVEMVLSGRWWLDL
ncbi:hypothetical protein ACOSQ4_007135 [Xanthoceras sorbifolium]